ncbi:beta-galactoside-binding lectin-like [Neosynchiropus ocellatus]
MGGNQSVDMSVKRDFGIRNVPFQVGQTLIVKGVVDKDAERFSLNIRPDDKDIALHITPRFKYNQHTDKVAYNSRQDGNWGTELVGNNFPFKQGEEFTVEVEFRTTEFLVILPNGNFAFPNRLGDHQYTAFNFNGDAVINSFDIVESIP